MNTVSLLLGHSGLEPALAPPVRLDALLGIPLGDLELASAVHLDVLAYREAMLLDELVEVTRVDASHGACDREAVLGSQRDDRCCRRRRDDRWGRRRGRGRVERGCDGLSRRRGRRRHVLSGEDCESGDRGQLDDSAAVQGREDALSSRSRRPSAPPMPPTIPPTAVSTAPPAPPATAVAIDTPPPTAAVATDAAPPTAAVTSDTAPPTIDVRPPTAPPTSDPRALVTSLTTPPAMLVTSLTTPPTRLVASLTAPPTSEVTSPTTDLSKRR
ncbi:hypothetical protein DMC30DRAFT_200707 [Rhodotorula diobovata]|uniref:Uncharacterized protein n=1 Tax=Rhodotorula diobovata TaxID=5288 RepID=A0A5C5FZ27_9BASI|nr:hypothetical protein DMC30DRAFT_200707 [Rhodotorula diobovata]